MIHQPPGPLLPSPNGSNGFESESPAKSLLRPLKNSQNLLPPSSLILIPNHHNYSNKSELQEAEEANMGRNKEQEVIDVPTRNTTLTEGVFNLTKSAVGVGTLMLASKFSSMGLLVGIALMLLVSLTSSISLYLLARLSANTDISSYFGLGKLALGGMGEITALLSLILYLIGALIAYVSLTGTFLNQSLTFMLGVTGNPWWLNVKFLGVLASLLLIFPMSCLKDMSMLGKTSIVGMACMAYVALLTVVDYAISDKAVDVNMVRYTPQLFASLGSILFAFTNHFTIVSIVPVMINPTPARRLKLISFSSIAVLVIYICVSVFGYLHFGNARLEAQPWILSVPAQASWPYAIAQLAVALVIVCSYPLLLDPTRAGLDQVFTLCFGNNASWRSLAVVRHFSITAFLVAFSTLIAVTCGGMVQTILSLFTSIAGSLLMFIFPSIYFLRLRAKYPVAPTETIMAWFNIVFGIAVMFLSTYSNVVEVITKFKAGTLMG